MPDHDGGYKKGAACKFYKKNSKKFSSEFFRTCYNSSPFETEMFKVSYKINAS